MKPLRVDRSLRRLPISFSTMFQEDVTENQEQSLKDAEKKHPLLLGSFPHGPTIKNKDSVFDDIDKALGVSKPPDIEVILTDHLVDENSSLAKLLHLNVLRFGHIAIRYTTSDGEQYVMNIMGDFTKPDSTLINFFKPSEYFYGTDPMIAQQGGVYSRPFVGVRIENVAPGATDALHSYYQAVFKASEIGSVEEGNHTATGSTPHDVSGAPGSAKRGAARFQLVEVRFSSLARILPSPFDRAFTNVANWIREKDDQRREQFLEASKSIQNFAEEQDDRFFDGQIKEMMEDTNDRVMSVRNALYQSGNCAQWTSGGLEFCGLIRRQRLFPKAILIDLLEDEYLANNRPENVNVVYYDKVEDSPVVYDGFNFIRSAMVSPLKPVRTQFYDDMKPFAKAIVEVPSGTDVAQVNAQSPQKVPERWLQYWTLGSIYVPAAVCAGLVEQVGPIGPATAAAWLAANWWLY